MYMYNLAINSKQYKFNKLNFNIEQVCSLFCFRYFEISYMDLQILTCKF